MPLAAWFDARCSRDPGFAEGHVRTLYLDTPGLRFFTEKLEGDYLKTKIRLRWYAPEAGAPASGPVWLEVKRREGVRRSKTRVMFAEDAGSLDRGDPVGIDVGRVIALVRQQGLDSPAWLRPSLLLVYSRSRWIDRATGTRVALDRHIQPSWIAGGVQGPPHAFDLGVSVAEFKGPDARIPASLRGVTRFGAQRSSFSKYYMCYLRLSGDDVDTEGVA